MTRKRVGLALSGGAARGAAHVGVIQVLEREGIAVDCVAGTSVGSLVGAAYAAGLSCDRLLAVLQRIRWRHIARPVWPRRGLLSFARLEPYVAGLLGDPSFSDLRLPCAVVTADVETAQPVVLREGRVAAAVRASCTIPPLVVPMRWQERWLVDGGVVNNLPISVVRELGADVVIAVDLHCSLGRRPRDLGEYVMWTLETLIGHCGDDPATADVHIPIPLTGMASLVRLSWADRALAAGQVAAEQALPAIRAAVGKD